MRPTEVGFRSPCAASCIFIRSGHFVCRLTSDAKSRAPIKAQRNKGAACLGAGPPRSRAPFTFVKEINLPLLSAGRGQSGRKRDACCRPGGGGGNLSLEAGFGLGEDKLPPTLATRKRQQRRSTHSQSPTHHLGSPVWTQIGHFAFVLFPAQPHGTQKAESPGYLGRTPSAEWARSPVTREQIAKPQKMLLCCVTHFIEKEGNGQFFFLENSVHLYRLC